MAPSCDTIGRSGASRGGRLGRRAVILGALCTMEAAACGRDEHVAFLGALETCDAEAAARTMGEHLDHILRDLHLGVLEKKPVDLAAALRKDSGSGFQGFAS